MHAYSDYGWFPCSEDPMTFEIIFYIDSLSRPGRQVASRTVILDAVATGVYYYDNTFELMEYTASFPTVSLTEGWLSIQGKGNPSCWFMWLSSRTSLDSISIQYGGGTNYMPWDFAFCLTGTTSCCSGFTGNVDCSTEEAPDISDITRLIDYLYLSHNALPVCPEK
ncbi:MAG: hypothetical protein JXA92_11615 [candidate division Zixibacteria bacterium]|nr:hypothetical protein [candidate division Zixibacteria bacterium]